MDKQKDKTALTVLKQLVKDIENNKFKLENINIECEAIPKEPSGAWEEWEPSNEIKWIIKLKVKE